jgi:hypothetical protein
VQRFDARATWDPSHAKFFPLTVDFLTARESSEHQLGSMLLRIQGLQHPLAVGLPAGRLEVTKWGQVGDLTYPAGIVLSRYSLSPGGTDRHVQERYVVEAESALLGVDSVQPPKPAAITSVSDSRVSRKGIPIYVHYNLTNEAWLGASDPRVIKLVDETEREFIAALRSVAEPHYGRGLVIAALLLLALMPLAVPLVRILRRRHKPVTYKPNIA